MTLTHPQYTNGRFPLTMLVHLVGSGGANHYLPPASAARWYELQRRAARWRAARGLKPIPLLIWPGWDAYRPIFAQQAAKDNACAQGNCLAAATVGQSSHGLVFRNADAAALDAGNWAAVYNNDYQAFFADARAVGFTADFIRPGVNGYPLGTPREFWHLFDFRPWSAVPAFDGAEPFPTAQATSINKGDDMPTILSSSAGQTLIIPPVVVAFATPAEVQSALRAGFPVWETTPEMHNRVLSEYGKSLQETRSFIIVYGDPTGTVYTFDGDSLDPIYDPSTIAALSALGGVDSVTWSPGEIAARIKAQKG